VFLSAIIRNSTLLNEVFLIVGGESVPNRGFRIHLQQEVASRWRHQITALTIGQFKLILDGVQVSG